MARTEFYVEDCELGFRSKIKTRRWIADSIAIEGLKQGDISIIFCSDRYLLEINKKHLNHDYFTDIITFDYREGDLISGDLFISIDTVKENAKQFGTDYLTELHRVIIHGVMHLAGYKDKTDDEAKVMRAKEDFYLARRQ